MTNVLILGATGSIARVAIEQFLKRADVQLTLYSRSVSRLKQSASSNVRIVEGDVLDMTQLKEAMTGQDVGRPADRLALVARTSHLSHTQLQTVHRLYLQIDAYEASHPEQRDRVPQPDPEPILGLGTRKQRAV